MKYFTNSMTLEEVKATYRTKAMQLHPDRGGSNEVIAERSQTMQQTKKMTFKASTLTTLYQNAWKGLTAETLSDKELLRAYASHLLARWHCHNSLRSHLYNQIPCNRLYLLDSSASKDLTILIEKELEKRNIGFECICVEGLQGVVEFDLTMDTVKKTKTTVKTASKLTA